MPTTIPTQTTAIERRGRHLQVTPSPLDCLSQE